MKDTRITRRQLTIVVVTLVVLSHALALAVAAFMWGVGNALAGGLVYGAIGFGNSVRDNAAKMYAKQAKP